MALVEIGQTGRPEFSPGMVIGAATPDRFGCWTPAASAIIDARDFAARREGEEQFDSP
jgi:hypothetical protein